MKNQHILMFAALISFSQLPLEAAETAKKSVSRTITSVKSTAPKLTAKAALEIIRNRPDVKEFFANVNKVKTAKPIIEVDRKEGTSYVIHVYELVPDGPDSSHTATMNWFYVDFNTKKVKADF